MTLREPDDLREPIGEHARLGRNYVALLAPLALIVAVVAMGVFGRLTAPKLVAPSPTRQIALRTPAPQVALPPSLAERAPSLDLTSAEAADSVFAASGRRLFYTIDGNAIESLDLTPGSQPRLLTQAGRCSEIDALAVSGTTLLYVEAQPGEIGVDSCAPDATIHWVIWAMDLETGAERRFATGSRVATASEPARPPVHFAVAGDYVAFERPVAPAALGTSGPQSSAPAASFEVEIRSLSTGTLLSTKRIAAPVRNLMLGGTTLAIFTNPTRGSSLPMLYLSDVGRDPLRLVTSLSTGASLSADGRYLVWDSGEPAAFRHSTLELMDLATGDTRELGNDIGPPGFPSVEPAVGNSQQGLVVAWYATHPGGQVGVRVIDPAHPHGAWLTTTDVPEWMSVQGDDLVWLEAAGPSDASSPLVQVVDLPTTDLVSEDGEP